MSFLIGIGQSLIANLLTPIALFIIAYWLRNSDAVVTFAAKVYKEVNNNYLILKELDEASNGSDVDDDHEVVDHKAEIPNDSSIDDILNKLSKDYGEEGNWKVRTYYTINRKQLDDFKYIRFSIREMTIKLMLSTDNLLDKFIRNSNEDDVVDGADKIRIFIFQNKDTDDYYLVRFGRSPFRKPYILQKDENGIYKVN